VFRDRIRAKDKIPSFSAKQARIEVELSGSLLP
jgi:hypothetical protein